MATHKTTCVNLMVFLCHVSISAFLSRIACHNTLLSRFRKLKSSKMCAKGSQNSTNCAIWTLLDWFAIQCNTRRIDCKLIPLVPLGESNDNSHLETAQDSGLYTYVYIYIYDFCLDSRPTFLLS